MRKMIATDSDFTFVKDCHTTLGMLLSHNVVLATFEDNKIQSAELTSESNKYSMVYSTVEYLAIRASG